MIHKNRLWVALVASILLMGGWFGVRAATSLHRYYRLSTQVEVEVKEWRIVGDGSSRYRLIAHYLSPYGEGEGVIGGVYRNPWAAEQAQSRFAHERLKAWFDPRRPEEMVFTKRFPLKAVVSAVVVSLLACYFIFLGFYVAYRDQKR